MCVLKFNAAQCLQFLGMVAFCFVVFFSSQIEH